MQRGNVIPKNIYHGSGGHIMINGKKLAAVTKFEAKVTGNWDSFYVCGEVNAFQDYTGYQGEGSITFLPDDSTILKLLVEGYQTGDMPDVTIISHTKQRGTNKVESIAFQNVSFTELPLAGFEANARSEVTLPFNFETFSVLSEI